MTADSQGEAAEAEERRAQEEPGCASLAYGFWRTERMDLDVAAAIQLGFKLEEFLALTLGVQRERFGLVKVAFHEADGTRQWLVPGARPNERAPAELIRILRGVFKYQPHEIEWFIHQVWDVHETQPNEDAAIAAQTEAFRQEREAELAKIRWPETQEIKGAREQDLVAQAMNIARQVNLLRFYFHEYLVVDDRGGEMKISEWLNEHDVRSVLRELSDLDIDRLKGCAGFFERGVLMKILRTLDEYIFRSQLCSAGDFISWRGIVLNYDGSKDQPLPYESLAVWIFNQIFTDPRNSFWAHQEKIRCLWRDWEAFYAAMKAFLTEQHGPVPSAPLPISMAAIRDRIEQGGNEDVIAGLRKFIAVLEVVLNPERFKERMRRDEKHMQWFKRKLGIRDGTWVWSTNWAKNYAGIILDMAGYSKDEIDWFLRYAMILSESPDEEAGFRLMIAELRRERAAAVGKVAWPEETKNELYDLVLYIKNLAQVIKGLDSTIFLVDGQREPEPLNFYIWFGHNFNQTLDMINSYSLYPNDKIRKTLKALAGYLEPSLGMARGEFFKPAQDPTLVSIASIGTMKGDLFMPLASASKDAAKPDRAVKRYNFPYVLANCDFARDMDKFWAFAEAVERIHATLLALQKAVGEQESVTGLTGLPADPAKPDPATPPQTGETATPRTRVR